MANIDILNHTIFHTIDLHIDLPATGKSEKSGYHRSMSGFGTPGTIIEEDAGFPVSG
jgi:hypothetical protein